MKKLLMIFIFTAALAPPSFAQADEVWLSVGLEYGNYFDSYTEGNTKMSSYTGSPGISIKSHRSFNKNFGYFAHGFIGVPVINSANHNFKNYDFRFQGGIVIGVHFRHNITEKFIFNCGLGVNIMAYVFGYEVYLPLYGNAYFDELCMDYGIASDIGIRYNFNEKIFLSLGTLLSYDFLRTRNVEASFGNTTFGFVKDFNMFTLRPYMTVGFYLFIN